MKTLLVVVHPRTDSLTANIGRRFAEVLHASGHEVEYADLAEERFDPALGEEDEPDWDNSEKLYSPAVRAEMQRIERNEAVVMVFPVWWWSMPALLKGWIDRVWNNGWAYGSRKIPVRRAWMIAIAGTTFDQYQKRGYDKAMDIQLKVGILDYCGVAEPRLEVLYGSMEGNSEVEAMFAKVAQIAAEF